MKHTMLILILALLVSTCFGTQFVVASCPPQQVVDVNSWPFTPDPNRVPGHYGEAGLWEVGYSAGLGVVEICDPEVRPITMEWTDIPVGAIVDENNIVRWTPQKAGIEAYFTIRITDAPEGLSKKETTFTFGALTVPANEIPVVNVEFKLIPF